MSTEVDIQITYSQAVTATNAYASAGRIGGVYLEYEDDVIYLDSSMAADDTGTSSASASVWTTFATLQSGPLLEGHFGNVLNYEDMPDSITGEVTVSGTSLQLKAGAFFDSYQVHRCCEASSSTPSLFFAGQSRATASADTPVNTMIQSISVTVTSKYILGLAVEPIDGSEDTLSHFITDPATVINLNVDGNHIAGGYILNKAGQISTYGELVYDDQTETFSFDSSALVGLNVSGSTTVDLVSEARLPGDFNGDEVVDATDIDLLYDQIAASYTPSDVFDIYDLNIDGAVNTGTDSDIEVLVETILMSKLGDANLDGYIGIEDQNAVLSHWNQTGVGYAEGDINGDNFVGMTDLNYILSNWGWGTPPSVGASIPEPTALTVAAVASFGLLVRRKS
jgi:hypothetical protein